MVTLKLEQERQEASNMENKCKDPRAETNLKSLRDNKKSILSIGVSREDGIPRTRHWQRPDWKPRFCFWSS
jgi:hypothetical protein